MKTEEVEDGLTGSVDCDARFRPLFDSSSFGADLVDPGTTDGSSNCPAGVKSSPPSGLKVSRR